ncbi:MAG: hypothetical protein OEY11_00515 [Gammaproteobacteria bacterium]|nr:hypothetical protein [Gammaproteobacteria bacterium]
MLKLNSPRLILTPIENEFSLADTTCFISALKRIKFLGPELTPSASQPCFDTGEHFLHQISFLGCSPRLYSDGESDIFIGIDQQSRVQFSHCHSMPPPRCPHCQKTNKNWPVNHRHWLANTETMDNCPQCDKAFHFTAMKWKKNGGYGRLLLQIYGVQEQLAVPNPSFLGELEALTETGWEYFFAT